MMWWRKEKSEPAPPPQCYTCTALVGEGHKTVLVKTPCGGVHARYYCLKCAPPYDLVVKTPCGGVHARYYRMQNWWDHSPTERYFKVLPAREVQVAKDGTPLGAGQ